MPKPPDRIDRAGHPIGKYGVKLVFNTVVDAFAATRTPQEVAHRGAKHWLTVVASDTRTDRDSVIKAIQSLLDSVDWYLKVLRPEISKLVTLLVLDQNYAVQAEKLKHVVIQRALTLANKPQEMEDGLDPEGQDHQAGQ